MRQIRERNGQIVASAGSVLDADAVADFGEGSGDVDPRLGGGFVDEIDHIADGDGPVEVDIHDRSIPGRHPQVVLPLEDGHAVAEVEPLERGRGVERANPQIGRGGAAVLSDGK